MAIVNEQVLQQLYVAYFNRPADPFGLAYWDGIVTANGGSTAAVSATFAASPEYQAAFKGLSPSQVVGQIYQNLFGHVPDGPGLIYWSNLLSTGQLSVSNIVTQIAGGAQGTDLTAYNDKVTAAAAFTDNLVTGQQILGYQGATANAAAATFLSGVVDDASLAAAIAPAALSSTIANITNPVPVVVNTNLTTGVDTFVGTSSNDVVNGSFTGTSASTWTPLDKVDGGLGNNTLNLSDTFGGIDLSIGTVKNFQTANITSTGGLVAGVTDISGWTGLTTANFGLKSATAQSITVADTTALNVTNSLAGGTFTGGSIINVTANSVNGAATVASTAATSAGVTALNVAIGGAATVAAETALTAAAVASGFITAAQQTAIDAAYAGAFGGGAAAAQAAAAVVDAPIATAATAAAAAAVTAATANNVTIATNAGTSATVTGGNVITIGDGGNATLTSVTLSGNKGAATLTSDALVNVSLASTTQNTVIANTTAKHTETIGVNAVTGSITDAAATTVNLNVTGAKATTASTVTLVTGAATAINVNNAATLTLTSTDVALTTLKVSGAGTFTTDVSAGHAALTLVDASASTGTNTVTLDDTVAAYKGGSGVDTVIVSGVATQTIDGGAGSADVIDLAGVGATILTAATAAKFLNFEVLSTTGGSGVFDASLLSSVKGLVAGGNTGATTFANVAAGTSLTLAADPTAAVTYGLKADTSSDSLVLNLGTAKTAGINFAGNAVNIGAIETVNIVSNGTVVTATGASTGTNALALTDAAVTKLVISGAESLTLTGLAGNTVTSIDTTAVSKGAAVSINGGAVTATAGATITNGNAALTFTGSAAAGKADTITSGNGANTIVEGNGNNVITVGTGANTITVGTGQNIVTFGAHAAGTTDTIHLGLATSANTYTTVTGLQHLDTIDLGAGNGVAVFAGGSAAAAHITLNSGTALFADYVQAASASTTAGANSVISWFQFGGNTYIVEDNNASTSFATTDNIVKLVGNIDLGATGSVATIAANHVVL